MIVKQLKGTQFNWDEEERNLSISQSGVGRNVVLSRVHMFSLARFIIRVVQRGRKRANRHISKKHLYIYA